MEKFVIRGELRRGRLSRLTRLRTVWWFNNLLFTRGMLLRGSTGGLADRLSTPSIDCVRNLLVQLLLSGSQVRSSRRGSGRRVKGPLSAWAKLRKNPIGQLGLTGPKPKAEPSPVPDYPKAIDRTGRPALADPVSVPALSLA
jgi:hypothetical protein